MFSKRIIKYLTITIFLLSGCAGIGRIEVRLDRIGEYSDSVSLSDRHETNPRMFLESAPADFKIDSGKISYNDSVYRYLGTIVVDAKGDLEYFVEPGKYFPDRYTTEQRKTFMIQAAISKGKKIDATHLVFGSFRDRQYTVVSSRASIVVPIQGVAFAGGSSIAQNVIEEGTRFICHAFRSLREEK